MRSHVTWYFSSRTDVEQMKGAEKEKMGKTLRWLSINVNFMWIYYVSIYVPGFCHLDGWNLAESNGEARGKGKIKIFGIFHLEKRAEITRWSTQSEGIDLKRNHLSPTLCDFDFALISHPFLKSARDVEGKLIKHKLVLSKGSASEQRERKWICKMSSEWLTTFIKSEKGIVGWGERDSQAGWEWKLRLVRGRFVSEKFFLVWWTNVREKWK